jgi:hypothetical protein
LTDQTNAAPAALEPAPVVMPGNLSDGDSFSAEQAFEAYEKKKNSPAEAAETAPAETESAEADAAPEGTTAEDKETEPDVPAISPPKSWSKDAHERWSKLDRETQEFLAGRDSEDQKAIKRALNEAADERKAVKAEREAAEQEKKGYQAKLPALMNALQDAADHEFPDIKTMADLERLSNQAHALWQTDPFTAGELQARLQKWQVHQQKMASVNAELQRAEGEKQHAAQQELNAYRNEHDKQFLEYAPELSDPLKAAPAKAIPKPVPDRSEARRCARTRCRQRRCHPSNPQQTQ